jgi:hypothetical protein
MSPPLHAYDGDGNPHFDLKPSQAKKQNLFFSVTEHQKVLAKPALEQWKLGEHLKMAFQHPPYKGEDVWNYIKRVKAQTWRNSGGAAKLGSQIHDALESVLRGDKKIKEVDPSLQKYIGPAIRYIDKMDFEILAIEKVVVNPTEGYAGTVDLACTNSKGNKLLIDWKTTKFKGRKVQPYQGQPEQVAAYSAAFFGEKAVLDEKVYGANCYIATDQFDQYGESCFEVVSYSPSEVAHHWETFKLTCELWRRTEKYDPRKQNK